MVGLEKKGLRAPKSIYLWTPSRGLETHLGKPGAARNALGGSGSLVLGEEVG